MALESVLNIQPRTVVNQVTNEVSGIETTLRAEQIHEAESFFRT
jgi:hypothetical protein